jgi:hypothetical protein
VSSRLSSAVSIAERGETQDGGGIAAQHQIEEEIAKIKRYEVGPTLVSPFRVVLAVANQDISLQDFTTIGMRQLPIVIVVAVEQLEPPS